MSVEAEALKKVEIIVVIDKHNKREITFHMRVVTGVQIKDAAGVPPQDDLATRHDGKLDLVTNDQSVTLHGHEHFYVFPPGTIS
jgi:hypothetical protein